VPAFMMKLLFGEMASVLLLGLQASNEKIRSTGYIFQFPELKEAMKDVLK
jgi:NAD dependent epimerase/dehydratase family enzyme